MPPSREQLPAEPQEGLASSRRVVAHRPTRRVCGPGVCGFTGKGHGHGGLRQHRACGAHSGRDPARVRRPSKAASSGSIRWSRRARTPGSNPTAGRGRRAAEIRPGQRAAFFTLLAKMNRRPFFFHLRNWTGDRPLAPLEPDRYRRAAPPLAARDRGPGGHGNILPTLAIS